jgi:hypothetical protein
MYSAYGDTALPVPGFPIRESAGQSLFSSSPRLIAAVHALHRLLVPRHPPCALTILTVIVDNYDARRRRGYNGDLSVVRSKRRACCDGHAVQFSRSGEGATGGLPAGLSKLSSTPGLVDVLDAPRGRRSASSGRARCAALTLAFEAGSRLRAP